MVKSGEGKMTINGKEPKDYFHTETDLLIINQPLEIINGKDKWDFQITVNGGGIAGQAGAVRHGIARALAEAYPDSKLALRKSGLLTRDSRMVERKKAGKPKARKRFQFSKR
jgi:small subunit ribosomal protein S9